jgi:hypothetical protein
MTALATLRKTFMRSFDFDAHFQSSLTRPCFHTLRPTLSSQQSTIFLMLPNAKISTTNWPTGAECKKNRSE